MVGRAGIDGGDGWESGYRWLTMVSASVSIVATGIGIDTDTDVSLSSIDSWVCFIRLFLSKNTNTEI